MKRECGRGFEECPFSERFLEEWKREFCPFGGYCEKKEEGPCGNGFGLE